MGQKNSSLNSMVLSNLKMVDSLSELESSVTSFVESEKGKSTLNHSSSLSKERLSNGKKKLNYIYIQNENLPNISIENDEFNELDKKILILSYASIKADFDQVGLISFMKYLNLNSCSKFFILTKKVFFFCLGALKPCQLYKINSNRLKAYLLMSSPPIML